MSGILTSAGVILVPCEILITIMSIKSTIAAVAASPFLLAGAAFAGPYVNVEANSGWTGTDYTGTNTDLHVGYDGSLGETASFYVQGGATVTAPDGTDGDTVPSGKLGLSASLTDALGVYLSLIHI